MSELKRYPVKMIRDFMKKDYKAREHCYICGSNEKLELHHLYCVSELFSEWCDKKGIRSVDTVDQVKELRVTFSEENADYLSNDNLYTLCKEHHMRLHSIYGRSYATGLALKVKNWIEAQRIKNNV